MLQLSQATVLITTTLLIGSVLVDLDMVYYARCVGKSMLKGIAAIWAE